MSGAFEPRVDSREIDSRQRRDLTAAREAATPELFGALEVAAAEGRTRLGELLAMSPGQHKAIENRLRRMADRRGLTLVKSRRRDRKYPEYGKYILVDAATKDVATGGNWSLDLADVEKILLGTEPTAHRLNARDCPMCGIPTYSLSGLVQGAGGVRLCGGGDSGDVDERAVRKRHVMGWDSSVASGDGRMPAADARSPGGTRVATPPCARGTPARNATLVAE